MKNILVKSLFKIRDTNWGVKDRSKETDLYEKYLACHDISLASFKDNLLGDWEYEFIGGEFDNIHEALKHTFFEIRRLWLENAPCNILYTDPDTIAGKPVDIWGRFDKFMMFNYTDPKRLNAANKFNQPVKHFFNAGVRYFPAIMDEKIWRLGLNMANDWDVADYNIEQIILNKMLWGQDITLSEALRPDLAYQAHWLPGCVVWYQNLWNGINVNDCSIIHVHSSRNIDVKLSFMQQIYRPKQT